MDYGSYIEYYCDRCGVLARRGWNWGRKKNNNPYVLKPNIVCTHSVHGTALPCCMTCANLRPYPW